MNDKSTKPLVRQKLIAEVYEGIIDIFMRYLNTKKQGQMSVSHNLFDIAVTPILT